MIEAKTKEDDTTYREMKYCDRIGGNVLVEQMKSTVSIIVKCRYFSLGACYEDTGSPRVCFFKHSKLVEVIED